MAGRRPAVVTIAAVCGALMAVICLLTAALGLGPAVDDRATPPIELVGVTAATWAATVLLVIGVHLLLTRGGRVVLVLGSALSLVAVWGLLVVTVINTGGRGLTVVPAVAMVSLLPVAAIFLPDRPEARDWRARVARDRD